MRGTRLLLAPFVLLGFCTPSALGQEGYGVGIAPTTRSGTAPLEVGFRLQLVTERGGRIRSADLDFGDGRSTNVDPRRPGTVRHTYTQPGTYEARLSIRTAQGQALSARATIRVAARRAANPMELLSVDRVEGTAPLEVVYSVGGESLPFTANRVVLDFGDGQRSTVLPLSEVRHTYTDAGRYRATLTARGQHGNVARARRRVRVVERPEPTLRVLPVVGSAPLLVDIDASAGIGAQSVRLLLGDELVSESDGRSQFLIEEQGRHEFRLVVRSALGDEFEAVAVVNVSLTDMTGFYEHDGGVVEIVESRGNFEGRIAFPSPGQVANGYQPGELMVSGAYAETARAASMLDPTARRQQTVGRYLIKNTDPELGSCEEQWADYRLNVEIGDPTRVMGRVQYAPWMRRYQRAVRRLGIPETSGGITGQLVWVALMQAYVHAAGDFGDIRDCIIGDEPSASRSAVFTRVTEERARERVGELIEQAELVERALRRQGLGDGEAGGALEDGTPRASDTAYGLPVASEEPVLLHSGEFFLSEVDLEGPVSGRPWSFQRTYRSHSRDATSLGHGWSHNAMFALVREGDAFLFRSGRGAWVRLERVGPGLWGGSGLRLREEQGRRVLRDVDGALYTFLPLAGDERRSRIVTAEDAAGYRLAYDCDLLGRIRSVIDELGQLASYRYDRYGLLSEVEAPGGERVQLVHDARGDLVEVRSFAPGAAQPYRRRRYAYQADEGGDLAHNLTALWLARDADRGQPSVEMRYGATPGAPDFDRVVWQRDGQVVEEFRYAALEEGGGRFFETESRIAGRATRVHRFDAGGNEVRRTHRLEDGGEVTTHWEYDAAGRLLRHVLPEGNARELARDAQGRVREVRHLPRPGSPLPVRVFAYEHEPVFGLLKATYGPFADEVPWGDRAALERELVLAIDYDFEEGDALAASMARFGLAAPAGGRGDLNGDGVTHQRLRRAIRTARPAADGQGGRVETLMRYDDAGRLVAVLEPGGREVRVEYADKRPLPARIVEHLGSDGPARTLRAYEWDEGGALVAETSPDGGRMAIVRDALGRAVLFVPQDPGRLVVRYDWDALGRVTEVWELRHEDWLRGEEGRLVSSAAYGDRGELRVERRWLDEERFVETRYEYDALGRLSGLARDGVAWQREYDPLGRVARELAAGVPGAEIRLRYDRNGNRVEETSSIWGTRTLRYDGHDRLVELADPAGPRGAYAWDLAGRLLEIRTYAAGDELIDARGWSYAPHGEPERSWVGRIAGGELAERRPLLERQFSAAGEVASQDLQDGSITHRVERGAGGVLRAVQAGDGSRVELGADALGRIARVTVQRPGANGLVRTHERRYGFDRWGDLAEIVGVGSGRVTVESDPWARTVRERYYGEGESAPRMERVQTFDGLGRHVAVRTIVPGVSEGEARIADDVSMAWDDAGRLIELIQNGHSVASFAYDAAGRLLEERFFDAAPVRFEHDGPGRTVTRIDARGARAVKRFDAAGRVDQVAHFLPGANQPEVVVRFDYDSDSNLVRAARGPWAVEHAFAEELPVGQVLVREDGGARYALERRFGPELALQTLRLPSGSEIAYARAADGRETVTFAGRRYVCSYDERGRLAALEWSGGSLERRGSEGAGVSLVRAVSEGQIVLAREQRLRLGSVAQVGVHAGGRELELNYDRDEQGRLTGGAVVLPGTAGGVQAVSFQIRYDAFGNRSSYALGDAETVYAASEGGYRYLRAGADELAYDADGRALSIGTRRFERDATGQVVGCVDPARGLEVRYARDSMGRVVERRTAASVTHYVYDADRLVSEYRDGALQREYVRDPYGYLLAIAEENRVWTAVTDHDGTLLALLDESGRVHERCWYGPFGEPFLTDAQGAPVREPTCALLFGGILYDPLAGVYLTMDRTYWPEGGRFLEPEPLGAFAATHPYAYALDDPLTFVDRYGLRPTRGDASHGEAGVLSSLLEWAKSPQDARKAGEFFRQLAGLWGQSTEGVQIVADAIEHGQVDQARLSQVQASFSSAFGSAKQRSRFGQQLKHNLEQQLINQMLAQTFGPAVLMGVFKGAGFAIRHGVSLGSRAARSTGQRFSRFFRWLRNVDCFVAGTLVLTPGGSVPIETLEVGDRVLARSGLTGVKAPRRVVGLHQGSAPWLVDLEVRPADGGAPFSLTCTPEHPFYVAEKGWTAARDLLPGSVLASDDESRFTVVALRRREGPIEIYNLEVEGWHSYFVASAPGGRGLWVHNHDGCGGAAAEAMNHNIANNVARLRELQGPTFRAAVTNFQRQITAAELQAAPGLPARGWQAGHAFQRHSVRTNDVVDILNNPTQVFTGRNANFRAVDIYYRAADRSVVITQAGHKHSVITAYGGIGRAGRGDLVSANQLQRWLGGRNPWGGAAQGGGAGTHHEWYFQVDPANPSHMIHQSLESFNQRAPHWIDWRGWPSISGGG